MPGGERDSLAGQQTGSTWASLAEDPINSGSIGEAFSFGEEELAANACGRLSRRQEEMLAGYVRSRGCGSRAAMITMGLTVLLMFGLFLLIVEPGSPGFRDAMPYAIGTWGFFLIAFVLFLVLGRFRSRDLVSGRISVAEGEVLTREKDYELGTAFYARVGGVRFQLHSRIQMELLGRYSTCRIYYVSNPPVHVVLSIEVTG